MSCLSLEAISVPVALSFPLVLRNDDFHRIFFLFLLSFSYLMLIRVSILIVIHIIIDIIISTIVIVLKLDVCADTVKKSAQEDSSMCTRALMKSKALILLGAVSFRSSLNSILCATFFNCHGYYFNKKAFSRRKHCHLLSQFLCKSCWSDGVQLSLQLKIVVCRIPSYRLPFVTTLMICANNLKKHPPYWIQQAMRMLPISHWPPENVWCHKSCFLRGYTVVSCRMQTI